MNYDRPLQRTSDKRWDFTTTNDGMTRSIGYCRAWAEFSAEQIKNLFGSQEAYEKYAAPYRAADAAGKFHTGGHATAQEARECYKQYELDFSFFYNPNEQSNHAHKCCVCGQWTTGVARIGAWTAIPACPAHGTVDHVAPHFEVHDSAHS